MQFKEAEHWMSYKTSEQAQLVDAANHDAFVRDIVVACAEATAHDPLACIFLDGDNFKFINDEYGHDAGDRVLVEIVKILRQTVGARGKCYRRGGEEFVALLPNFTEIEAAVLAERIQRSVSCLEWGERMPAKATISIGVAAHTLGSEPTILETKAGKANKIAKRRGRDRVETDTGVVVKYVFPARTHTGPVVGIIDSDKFVRDILSDFLGMEGYESVLFADARSALESQCIPELLFVSLEMKDMAGPLLLSALKPKFPRTPLIAMSGTATPGAVVDSFRAGCREFVLKPFKVEQIVEFAVRFAGPARSPFGEAP
jgi:diguanylate cyclase (GGDEF)-like protein